MPSSWNRGEGYSEKEDPSVAVKPDWKGVVLSPKRDFDATHAWNVL
jgi:hypothetical protein